MLFQQQSEPTTPCSERKADQISLRRMKRTECAHTEAERKAADG
jgi:hypothetical protein